jgi:hypothetical protein
MHPSTEGRRPRSGRRVHPRHWDYDRLVQEIFLLASESQAFVSRVVRCRPAHVVGEISEAFVGRERGWVREENAWRAINETRVAKAAGSAIMLCYLTCTCWAHVRMRRRGETTQGQASARVGGE